MDYSPNHRHLYYSSFLGCTRTNGTRPHTLCAVRWIVRGYSDTVACTHLVWAGYTRVLAVDAPGLWRQRATPAPGVLNAGAHHIPLFVLRVGSLDTVNVILGPLYRIPHPFVPVNDWFYAYAAPRTVRWIDGSVVDGCIYSRILCLIWLTNVTSAEPCGNYEGTFLIVQNFLPADNLITARG